MNMSTGPYKWLFLFPALIVLAGCGATNPEVYTEYNHLTSLQKTHRDLEKDYLFLLGHLEKYPDERPLRLKQGEMKKELTRLSVEIREARDQLNLSVREWEARVTGGRLEQQLIDKTVKTREKQRP